MKKAISLLSLILCLVMAFSLVACGDSGSSSTENDDKGDTKSNVSSETSSTESTTEGTGPATSTTASTDDSTTSQPATEEVSSIAYIITEDDESIVYVIIHNGEQIVGMSEGIAYAAEDGETFSQEDKDDFKEEVEDAWKDLDPNFTSYEIFTEDDELSALITFTDLDIPAGLNYYMSQTDIPEEIFFDGVTFSQLNQSFIDAGFTELK